MKKLIILQSIGCITFIGIILALKHLNMFSVNTMILAVIIIDILNIINARLILMKPIEDLSEHDKLTGCHNRVRLDRRIPEYEKHDNYAVIFFDINHFKQVNDAHGHDDGDLLLVRASDQLRFWLSCGDLYRIGGDEFIVVVPNMPPSELLPILHQWYSMQPTLNNDYNDTFECKFSYGICYKTEGRTFNDVMNKADEEMYAMKRSIETKHLTFKNIIKKTTEELKCTKPYDSSFNKTGTEDQTTERK